MKKTHNSCIRTVNRSVLVSIVILLAGCSTTNNHTARDDRPSGSRAIIYQDEFEAIAALQWLDEENDNRKIFVDKYSVWQVETGGWAVVMHYITEEGYPVLGDGPLIILDSNYELVHLYEAE